MEIEMKIGDKVSWTKDGFTNVGQVMDIDDNPVKHKDGKTIYVRWHKGYSSWMDASVLVVVPPEAP